MMSEIGLALEWSDGDIAYVSKKDIRETPLRELREWVEACRCVFFGRLTVPGKKGRPPVFLVTVGPFMAPKFRGL